MAPSRKRPFGVPRFGKRSASSAASGCRPPAARRLKRFIRPRKKSFARWPKAIRKTSTRPSMRPARRLTTARGRRWMPAIAARSMYKLADLIEEEADELAALETLDNGKPISDSRAADIPLVIDCLRYYAGWADKIQGPDDSGPRRLFLLHAARAGRRRRADHSVELPGADGRVEVGPGAGGGLHDRDEAGRADAADLLADGAARAEGRHSGRRDQRRARLRSDGRRRDRQASGRRQDRVHRRAARRPRSFSSEAAETMKRLTFELGGKSPNVIFADADLDAAVEGAHFGLYFNQGQCCCAGSRLFVEEKVHDEVIDRIAEKNADRKVGDPFDPETQQGPQVDKAQFDKILKYIEYGKQDGAKMRHRRQAARQQGLLRRADAVRRRDRRHADRPRGDLWPGAERAEVQECRRDHPAGRTTRTSAWRRPSGPATSPRPTALPRECGPARCGSIATTCSTRRPRSAASSKAASAASWAKPGLANYTELKTVTVSMT